ncbi:asparagine synthase-related protein [Streptomyces sp. NPDC001678]|uniref:asparagine synthase-related protein n=1 Tax=Streptomyces sp. NPDC001678 TaxID=3364599 RepID=UPI0036C0E7CF
MTVAHAGAVRLAVIGRCPVTAGALLARARRIGDVSDVERAVQGLAGSFHVVASVAGRVRVRGSASGLRRVFHTRVGGVTVAASRADRLASLTGAGVDERLLAPFLLATAPPHPLGDRCPWHGVREVPPWDCLIVEPDGRARTRRWWTPPEPVLPAAEGAREVRRALLAAVASRTAGGGTVSSDLSGGMDSTSLCFLAARSRAHLVTLHWEGLDPGNDDTAWAARAAAELPTAEHVRTDRSRLPLWLGGLTGFAIPTEEPGCWVRDTARRERIVTLLIGRGSRLHLTGIGGDELFTAFPPHLHDYFRARPLAALARIRRQSSLHRWPLLPMLRGLADRSTYRQWVAGSARGLTRTPPPQRAGTPPSLAWGSDPHLPPWATPDAAREVRGMLRDAAADAEPLAPQRGQHAALAYVRAGARSARQLHQVSSALGLEHAAPYFDDGVVEAALSVRVPERNAPHRYKPVLATAMRGTVPEALLGRSTKGEFTGDFYAGLRHNRAELLRLFEDSRLARAGLVDAAAVRAILLGLHATPEALRHLEPTLACEVWLRSLTVPGATPGGPP